MAMQRQPTTRTSDSAKFKTKCAVTNSALDFDGAAYDTLQMQHTFGNRAVQQRASTCSAFSSCPTGGVCHPCPHQIQVNPGAIQDKDGRHAGGTPSAATMTRDGESLNGTGSICDTVSIASNDYSTEAIVPLAVATQPTVTPNLANDSASIMDSSQLGLGSSTAQEATTNASIEQQPPSYSLSKSLAESSSEPASFDVPVVDRTLSNEGVDQSIDRSVSEAKRTGNLGDSTPVDEDIESPGSKSNSTNDNETCSTISENSTPLMSATDESESKLVVADSVLEVSDQQMRKSEFLAYVRVQTVAAVEEIIAPTGRTTKDCHYLNLVFEYFGARSARYIDRALHQFVPEASMIKSAADAVPWIIDRVRQTTENWLSTGQIAGLPQSVPEGLRSAVVALHSGTGSSSANVLFKEREGGARQLNDFASIQSQLGDGRPLETGVRSRMESAFDRDFSNVRMHTDATARELSNSFNARAFAIGSHIAFGAGEYQPSTLVGDALIAHELAHVVQQERGMQSSSVAGSANDRALEQDADLAAANALQLLTGVSPQFSGYAQNAVPRLRSGLQLRRCRDSTSVPVSVTATPVVPPAELRPAPWVTASAGPVHHQFGGYQEYIGWTTTARSGFIVQKIANTYSTTVCPPAAAAAGQVPTPQYWEAWSVAGNRTVSPGLGGVNDMWLRPPVPGAKGGWSMDAEVYWVANLDPAATFGPGSVPDAGQLLSTTTAPKDLSASLLNRHAGGQWDCAGVHTPK